MNKVCFINGSPRGKNAVSAYLLNKLNENLDIKNCEKHFIDVNESIRKNNLKSDFERIANSSVIVIAFPLYVYCLPGILSRFLEKYYEFAKNKENGNNNIKVYAISNCGFPEPEINKDALMVIKNFCNRLNLNWRFGIGIGMGGMINSIKEKKLMKLPQINILNSLKEIKKDMIVHNTSLKENIFTKLSFPNSLYLTLGTKGWIALAKSNGLNKEDLFKQPYI